MTYSISLKIQPTTYQRFETIHQKLNAGETESQSKALGDNLADIACEILDQVFGQMARMNKSGDNESEKIIQQIRETTRKYMPWSVSFFAIRVRLRFGEALSLAALSMAARSRIS